MTPAPRPLGSSMDTIRFKNDAPARKRLFVAGAMAHPAKGHIALWQEMIERYTQPGDWVLDPMSGIGTSLVAALMGRNVVCVELEPHFVEPMKASWAKMQGIPMLGYTMGRAVILRGDARALPLCSADAVITSPPWEDKTALQDSQWLHAHEPELAERFRQAHAGEKGLPGNTKPVNRSTMEGYTRPAAIITSPPYEGSITGDTSEATRKRIAEGKYNGLRPDVFTSPSNVAGSTYGDGYSRPGGGEDADGQPGRVGGQANGRVPQGENIGNQRGVAYWTSMALCYAECWRVLRPGGILALVLKGFTREGKYVDLPGQTEALLLAAGWDKHDHFRRELWSLSFWRILQKRRDPAAFDDRLNFEEVLAFRKPEGAGDGVAAVLTSPPYEQSVTGEPGIDWTKTMGGARDRTKEDAFQTVKAIHSGYTRPSAIITSPPYEGTLQGDKPSGNLFETERRVNSPASGNRRSKRKPLGHGYTKE